MLSCSVRVLCLAKRSRSPCPFMIPCFPAAVVVRLRATPATWAGWARWPWRWVWAARSRRCPPRRLTARRPIGPARPALTLRIQARHRDPRRRTRPPAPGGGPAPGPPRQPPPSTRRRAPPGRRRPAMAEFRASRTAQRAPHSTCRTGQGQGKRRRGPIRRRIVDQPVRSAPMPRPLRPPHRRRRASPPRDPWWPRWPALMS